MSSMSVGPEQWFVTRELAGVRLHVLSAARFKTITAKLAVRLPLAADGVTANALIPFVLRRGTRRLPTVQAIARALESMYGARLSVDVGKVGEVQLIEVRGEAVADTFLPGGGREHRQLRDLLQLLLEVLYDPALAGDGFVAEYVAQEKEVLRKRIEGVINNKPQYAVHRLYQEMCRGEPFALHRLGRLEDLPALAPGGLLERYRQQVVLRRADLAVVGPVEADRVAEWTAQLLEGLPFAPRPQLDEPPPARLLPAPAANGWRQVEESQEVRQEVLALGLRCSEGWRSPCYPALLVYNGVVGGFPHSRLFVHVRERHSLAYFVYSRLEATKGIMVVSAGIDPAQRTRVLEVVEAQLREVAAGQVGDDELEATRRGTLRRLQVAGDDPWAVLESWTVGMVNGYQRPPAQLMEAVRRVGRDEVAEVAARVRPDTLFALTARRAGSRDGAAGSHASDGGSGARGGDPGHAG